MKSSRNPFGPPASLPTLAAIEQRRRELLAYQAGQPQPEAHPNISEELETDAFPAEEDQEDQEEFLSPEEEHTHPDPIATAPETIPTLAPEALHGLAGQAVRMLAPHTEADPAAILLQFLTAFGNLIGPAPHCLVGPTRHGLNLFLILVGESSKARKGTSWRQIASLFSQVDPAWANTSILTARPTTTDILKRSAAKTDPNPRLLLLAEEFASVLHVLAQQHSLLSPLLRCAWDGGNLTRHDHDGESNTAHLSLVGHITQAELAPLFGRPESHNGFANRCLWATVRRSQFLPDGGRVPEDEQTALANNLREAFDWVRRQNDLLFTRSTAARDLWNDVYPELAEGRADAYGAATSRAEAQVLRLSALFAALDRTAIVDVPHLQAALAVWDYCRASAKMLFDTAPIDPIARRINQALDDAPDGLSRTAILHLFHGHVSKERIDLALDQLTALGLTSHEQLQTRGRPTNRWSKIPNSSVPKEVAQT
jgi:hypothetical protein